MHVFSDREALCIAVEIERKGERFYRMARAAAGNGEAGKLLEKLCEGERAHAARFSAMLEALPEGGSAGKDYDAETAAYLSAVASEVVFPGGVLAGLMNRRLETMRDVLLRAIDAEKDSLLFYLEMWTESGSEAVRPVLREIIAEEKRHLVELNELLENTEPGRFFPENGNDKEEKQ